MIEIELTKQRERRKKILKHTFDSIMRVLNLWKGLLIPGNYSRHANYKNIPYNPLRNISGNQLIMFFKVTMILMGKKYFQIWTLILYTLNLHWTRSKIDTHTLDGSHITLTTNSTITPNNLITRQFIILSMPLKGCIIYFHPKHKKMT